MVVGIIYFGGGGGRLNQNQIRSGLAELVFYPFIFVTEINCPVLLVRKLGNFSLSKTVTGE